MLQWLSTFIVVALVLLGLGNYALALWNGEPHVCPSQAFPAQSQHAVGD